MFAGGGQRERCHADQQPDDDCFHAAEHTTKQEYAGPADADCYNSAHIHNATDHPNDC